MPEGRQIARITRHGRGYAVDIDPGALKGLRGPRLNRALRCSKCGFRDAKASIHWKRPPRDPQQQRSPNKAILHDVNKGLQ
jgi:hypothetical protein